MSEGVVSLPERIGRLVVQTIYPPACLHCDAALYARGDGFLCEQCHEELEFIGDGACRLCGAPAGEHAELGKGCAECRPHVLRFTRSVSVLQYGEVARPLIHAFKFHGERRLAESFAEMMSQRLREEDFSRQLQCVLPVPLHPQRMRERGYNQAELLARHIAQSLRIPCKKGILHRHRHTPAQATLILAERLKNPTNAFSVEGRLDGETVLLVDDVLTTGSTASECATVLRDAGASRIYVITLAR